MYTICITLTGQVAGGISAPLIGMLHDHNGSYDLALIYMIAGYVPSAPLYLAVGRYRYTTDFKVIPSSEQDPSGTFPQ